MSQGKTAHTTIAEVKSHVNSLEISPSHRSASSPIARGGSKAVGRGVKEKTTSHIPKKKNLMHGKSKGR